MNEVIRHDIPNFFRHPQTKEKSLRSILDSVSDGYVLLGRDLRIEDANIAAASWLGSPVEGLLGRDLFEVFDKDASIDRKAIVGAIESGRQQKFEMFSGCGPGRWVEAEFHPGDHQTALLFRDITERRSVELVGEKAADLLASALDATSSEIAILDEAGRVLVANRAWHRFVAKAGARRPDNGIGAFYLELRVLHPVKPQQQSFRAGVRAVLAGERADYQMNFRTKVDGRYRCYRLRVAGVESSSRRRILVARDDVTELETALNDVDNMAVRLVNLQEQERQRYAAELHDSTVQHLTAASLNLMVLRNRLGRSGDDAIIAAVEDSVSEAQREIRSVSYLLYPRTLDEDGLKSTLARFASGYSSRTQIDASLRTHGAIDGLPLPLQRSVLRIVQEAVANVHRHAHATSVRITVGADRRRLSISVADDGRGLAKNDDGSILQPGVGISGMKARVHHFGGCLKLRSAGRGTLVFARIPLPSLAGASDAETRLQ